MQRSHIIIAGDSAEGNLCAALCIKLHEMRHQKPFAQILFYPCLFNNFNSESFIKFGLINALTKDMTVAFTAQYAGVGADMIGSVDNRLIFPLMEDNVEIFPRTFMVSAECDVLIDEQKALLF